MAGREHNGSAQAGNGASRASGPVRGYGMGPAGGQGAPSAGRPVPPAGQGQMPYVHLQGMPQQAQPYAGQVPYPGQRAYVPPATSVAPPEKRRRGAAFWVCIVVVLICIGLACALAFTMCGGSSKRSGEAGQLEGKTEAEIQAELDRTVEEGMFNISIASTVQLETGTSEGDLRIENVPGNPYLMQVVITRDDTGDAVYTTDMIEPNHHIQRDTLDADLDPGSYECTATFYACDPETEEVVGQAAAKMLVVVSG